MLRYFCDFMEDANDFSWASAKTSHAVLLYEMEKDALGWNETNGLDRIYWARALRHFDQNKINALGSVKLFRHGSASLGKIMRW